MKIIFYESIFEEGLKRKRVVRKGKPVYIWTTTTPNKKVVYKDGKPREVTKTASETKRRKLGSKITKRKSRPKMKQAIRKRKISQKKRSW